MKQMMAIENKMQTILTWNIHAVASSMDGRYLTCETFNKVTSKLVDMVSAFDNDKDVEASRVNSANGQCWMTMHTEANYS